MALFAGRGASEKSECGLEWARSGWAMIAPSQCGRARVGTGGRCLGHGGSFGRGEWV